MNRIYLLVPFLFVFLFPFSSSSQVTRNGNTYTFTSGKKTVRIELCSPTIFRVRHSATGKFEANEPWMVEKYNWSNVAATFTDKKDLYGIQTASLIIRINKPSLTLDVLSLSGKLLSSETTNSGGGTTQGDTVRCTK